MPSEGRIMTDQPGAYDIVPRVRTVYPRDNGEFADLDRLIDEFIVDKAVPPFFGKDTRFFTQGSCFAENLNNTLHTLGYSSYYNQMVEALNSPVANAIYLSELARTPDHPVARELRAAEIFILTIGVAPCWFLKATGEFVFEPNLRRIGDYVQRTLPVAEARDALLHVFKMVREINPALKIVLTLSPVPLARTFEFHSAIVADALSKGSLRAAIHEALTAYAGDNPPFYFPSFEIVRWVGAHRGEAFGDDGLPRHVSKHYVEAIIRAFIRNYGIAADGPTGQKAG